MKQSLVCCNILHALKGYLQTDSYEGYNQLSTNLNIEELNKKEQLKEVAKLLSGNNITKTSLEHAHYLLTQTKNKQISLATQRP